MDLFDNFTPKSVRKGTILLHKGEFCNCTYKVLKGCLRSYVVDKSGKEHIVQFAPEDWLIGDIDSFFHNKPTVLFIDAIEDSEVLQVTKDVIDNIKELDKSVITEHLYKSLRNMIANQKRLIALLSSTAEERYTDFIETYPALMQRIPLRYIASYLGMTPEYLSDVRRKLAKK